MKKRDSGRGNRVGLSSLGFTTVLIVLLALLVFSVLASITFGNADLSVKEVYSVVAYELFHIRKFSDFAEGAVTALMVSRIRALTASVSAREETTAAKVQTFRLRSMSPSMKRPLAEKS